MVAIVRLKIRVSPDHSRPWPLLVLQRLTTIVDSPMRSGITPVNVSYEVVPVFRAHSGLRMNGQGDLQDERKEHETDIECATASLRLSSGRMKFRDFSLACAKRKLDDFRYLELMSNPV